MAKKLILPNNGSNDPSTTGARKRLEIPQKKEEAAPEPEPIFEPEPEPDPMPAPVIPVTEPEPTLTPESEEDEEDNPKGKRKRKGKKRSKKTKEKTPKDNTPESVQKRYMQYRIRKYIVIGCFVLLTLALIFFGTYNTFFKHIPTGVEMTLMVNDNNAQKGFQRWESGVQGFLQRNLTKMIMADSVMDGTSKDLTVDDIAIEFIQHLDAMNAICYFSADLNLNGQTSRVLFELPIQITEDAQFIQAGKLSMTVRESFVSDDASIAENPYLDTDDLDVDEDASKRFENVLENFLTLGYNEDQDVSNIYQGETPIDFQGTFNGIIKCEVFKEPNAMKFNAKATYSVTTDNGLTYKTTNLFKVEEQPGGLFIIKSIL